MPQTSRVVGFGLGRNPGPTAAVAHLFLPPGASPVIGNQPPSPSLAWVDVLISSDFGDPYSFYERSQRKPSSGIPGSPSGRFFAV